MTYAINAVVKSLVELDGEWHMTGEAVTPGFVNGETVNGDEVTIQMLPEHVVSFEFVVVFSKDPEFEVGQRVPFTFWSDLPNYRVYIKDV